MRLEQDVAAHFLSAVSTLHTTFSAIVESDNWRFVLVSSRFVNACIQMHRGQHNNYFFRLDT